MVRFIATFVAGALVGTAIASSALSAPMTMPVPGLTVSVPTYVFVSRPAARCVEREPTPRPVDSVAVRWRD
jgi:hypothetical protein